MHPVFRKLLRGHRPVHQLLGRRDRDVDRRDAVVRRHDLVPLRRPRQAARLEVRQPADHEGVDEADVGVRVRAPDLAHDALHGPVDRRVRRPAVVDRELDEDEVRPLRQHVSPQPERAQVGAGPADGGVHVRHRGFRERRLEPLPDARPVGGLLPITRPRARRDGPAEVRDGDGLARRELGEHVRQPVSRLYHRERHSFLPPRRRCCQHQPCHRNTISRRRRPAHRGLTHRLARNAGTSVAAIVSGFGAFSPSASAARRKRRSAATDKQGGLPEGNACTKRR